ncbi:MAG TPA: hypothetical protein VFO69_05495 [Allosphingosinicella sp.]|nr:hypothetical protein [Allosphingosinicella sp.]
MLAATVGVSFQLPLEIPRVEAGEARRAGAVAASVESMTGEAGIVGPRFGAAQRNEAAVRGESVDRYGFGVDAGSEKGRQSDQREIAHRFATLSGRRLFRAAATVPLLMAAACKAPPEPHPSIALADPANGKAVIERVGCGSCHDIPGIDWPKGTMGPSLDGLARRGLVAGRLPNRPDVLAFYVRDAPALVPDSAMPAMPITGTEARDVAAYLYGQEGR